MVAASTTVEIVAVIACAATCADSASTAVEVVPLIACDTPMGAACAGAVSAVVEAVALTVCALLLGATCAGATPLCMARRFQSGTCASLSSLSSPAGDGHKAGMLTEPGCVSPGTLPCVTLPNGNDVMASQWPKLTLSTLWCHRR